MNAGLFDVLHDRGDVASVSVRQRIDVDLDGILEEAIDEHPAVDVVHRLVHLFGRVADAHRPVSEDVRRPHEHRGADALRDL